MNDFISERDVMNGMYNKLTLDNPGAITVMMELFDNEYISVADRYAFIRRCEDSSIVGSKMWAGYKYSVFNIQTFCNNVLQNNNEMVSHINDLVNNGCCNGPYVSINIE